MGENPTPKISKATTRETVSSMGDKDVLTGLIRTKDKYYEKYLNHCAKEYDMEAQNSANVLAVKYLLPMVAGKIDGYYHVNKVSFCKNTKGMMVLRLNLGEYVNLGKQWVQIYRSKMQPGELISLIYTEALYNSEV